MGIALPILNSDHSPIVLHPNPPSRSPKVFRYERVWEEHDDCRRVVAEGWSNPVDNNSRWDNFNAKARNSKKALMSWDKNTFKNAANEILKLKAKIQRLTNNGLVSGNSEEVNGMRKEIDRLWKQEEMFWGQSSRVKQLSFGD